MTRKRSDPLWRRPFAAGLFLVALLPAGCSSWGQEEAEPTPREVQKALSKHLKERERITLYDFHEQDKGEYWGTAEGQSGITYDVTVKPREGGWLHYTLTGKGQFRDAPILSGSIPMPVSRFRERHYELMQWLRAVACVVQGLAVVWAVLGRFGYRRPYSPRVEMLLTVVAAVNLGFALLWGYEFYTNWGAG